MEDYKIKWEKCLSEIRERVTGRENGERIFKVWFGDLSIESYDAGKRTVVLRVPSKYVYEYLEMYCVRLLSEVLSLHFGQGTCLSYRLPEEPALGKPIKAISEAQGPIHIQIPNAHKRLEDGLRYYLCDRAKWLPAYDKVADWLSDNKGRGLLIVGTPGLGKTLICQNIISKFLEEKRIDPVFVSATEMNGRIDDLLKTQCIIIDDLGKEHAELIYDYGKRRTPFFELCNAAEQEGKLLIINTNLSTTPDPRYALSIQQKYGDAVISRLRAITRVIEFEGDDLRR